MSILSLLALAPLAGTATDLFQAPFRVRDGQRLIDVEAGHAAPLVGDFDGDGLPDLLVGQFADGKLRIYKNTGSARDPRFDGFTWFKAGDQEGKVPSG